MQIFTQKKRKILHFAPNCRDFCEFTSLSYGESRGSRQSGARADNSPWQTGQRCPIRCRIACYDDGRACHTNALHRDPGYAAAHSG